MLNPPGNGFQGLFKAFVFSSTFQGKFNFQDSPVYSSTFQVCANPGILRYWFIEEKMNTHPMGPIGPEKIEK